MFHLQINLVESWDKLKGPLSLTGTVTWYLKSAYSIYFFVETYNFLGNFYRIFSTYKQISKLHIMKFFDQYFIVVNQNNSSFAIISFFHQFLNLRFHFTTVFTMFIYPSFLLRKMHTNIIIIIIIIIIIKNPQLIKRIRLTSLRLVSESTMRVSMGLTVSSKTALKI